MAERTITVKQEPVDLESRIIELCQANPKGITDTLLQVDCPQFDAGQRVHAINKLLTQGKIELLKSGTTLVYRYIDTSIEPSGGDNQENMVFKVISESGNKGVWIRDIRFKTNLVMPQLNKILKGLEGKKLIKAVKSVAASKKKVYMLYNLEPDRSVTGGTWYSDQDFDTELVTILSQVCYKFLEQKATIAKEGKSEPIAQRNAAFVSLHDIWKYIGETGISKVQLKVEDVEVVLNTLVFDGKAEARVAVGKGPEEQVKTYCAIVPLVPTAPIVRVPCGLCPVRQNCHPGGEVSPATCVYINDWINL